MFTAVRVRFCQRWLILVSLGTGTLIYFMNLTPQEIPAYIAGFFSLCTTIMVVSMNAKMGRERSTQELRLAEINAKQDAAMADYNAVLEKQRMEYQIELNKQLAVFSAAVPRRQQDSEQMIHTVTLLERVFTSFHRLSRLAPDLSYRDMLTETTNTLLIYADYTTHVASPACFNFPSDIRDGIEKVRESLSIIFLYLQADEESRGSDVFRTTISDHLTTLRSWIDHITSQVREVTAVA
jgi:hypothetical protein